MLKIGWATRDITPNRPALLMGQKHRRIGRSARDPVTVTAWVFDDGEPSHASALVSCDLVAPSKPLVDRVRRAVASELRGLLPEHVVLFATHTHTSFVLEDDWYEAPGGEVMTSAECEAWVTERVIGAIVEAWETRTPRSLVRAFGHAVVGHNRYAVYADGHAQMYGKTNRNDFVGFAGYEDHGLDVLLARERDGRLAGIALAIPCPSQVTENLEEFSADYWHEVRVDLRGRFGEPLSVLPMCSAAGDQSPHFLIYARQEEEMRRRRGLDVRQEIARRVGEAVALAVATAPHAPSIDETLLHEVRNLGLTPRKVSAAEREWAKAEFDAAGARGGRGGTWWLQGLQRVLDTFDGRHRPGPFPVETHVLRVGDLAIATNPFELFLDYGMQIKARSPAAQTVLVQLTGRGMYLPSARALQGGGYGVNPVVSAVGPEGGREMVEDTLATLQQLFPTPA